LTCFEAVRYHGLIREDCKYVLETVPAQMIKQ